MRNTDAGHSGCRGQAGESASGDRRIRIVLAREHDRDAGVSREYRAGQAAEAAGGGREQQTRQRRDQARQNHLGLRVAEPGVEFDHPDALGRENEAAVEQTDEGGVLGGELAHRGQRDRFDDLVYESLFTAEFGVEPGQRRIGAHAAGVRAEVTVTEAFVVLGGGERQHAVAVAEQEEGDLLPVQEFFDQHAAVLKPVDGMVDRGRTVHGDEHALAGGEAVGLHHVGRPELVECGRGFGERPGAFGASGGHARGIHDAFGEGFAAFEGGCGPVRTEYRDAPGAQRIGDPGDERRLRPHHDELDAVEVRVVRDLLGVGRVERNHRHIPGDAGIAWRRHDVVARLLAEQRGDDGVLAGTGTEDQNLHPVRLADAA